MKLSAQRVTTKVQSLNCGQISSIQKSKKAAITNFKNKKFFRFCVGILPIFLIQITTITCRIISNNKVKCRVCCLH